MANLTMWRSPPNASVGRKTTAKIATLVGAYREARKVINSPSECQFGVQSRTPPNPSPAHVCRAFAFITRSTSG